MQTPKLLPWLACRHGIPLERAKELYSQAIALAERERGPGAGTSEYWACAIRMLLRLLRRNGVAMNEAEEIEEPMPRCVRYSALPMLEVQRRLGGLAFDTAEAFLRATNVYWSGALRAEAARRGSRAQLDQPAAEHPEVAPSVVVLDLRGVRR